MKLSVLMPVYNEARTLRQIVARVLASPISGEIELICVDDGSTDRSGEILAELSRHDDRVVLLTHPFNRGKGAAVRTAISAITGDLALIQDSDLEYDPLDYPRLLKPIVDGRADAVFGSRFTASPERRVLLYWHSLGNKALTWLTNVLNDLNLTDMESCYKAVRADIIKSLRLRSERFGIEPELTTRLAQWGARIYEVPISYHGRTYLEGKNIGWRDGVQAIWLLVKFRFFDTRFSNRKGYEALESMARTPGLAAWTMEQFESEIGARVLDAGCGMGRFSELLLNCDKVTAVDSDPFYVEALLRRFGHLDNVEVFVGDLSDPGLYSKLGSEAFDTVLCVNVLEHLDNAELALRGFADVLVPGGRLIVVVPAHKSLQSISDEVLGHRRRYTRQEPVNLMAGAGLAVVRIGAFNRLGAVGWWWNKVRKRQISRCQARTFGFLMPIARLIERLPLPGLSWVIIGRKPEGALRVPPQDR